MKTKPLTYLLICSVACVWGLIFYRVYLKLEEEPMTNPLTVGRKERYFNLVHHLNDTVELNMDYPDPFTKKTAIGFIQEMKMATGIEFIKPANIIKPTVNWSAISYNGFIYNANTKQRLALLTVNGKEGMLREGEALNGLKLLKNWGDSIRVNYQSETKNIKIKQ